MVEPDLSLWNSEGEKHADMRGCGRGGGISVPLADTGSRRSYFVCRLHWRVRQASGAGKATDPLSHVGKKPVWEPKPVVWAGKSALSRAGAGGQLLEAAAWDPERPSSSSPPGPQTSRGPAHTGSLLVAILGGQGLKELWESRRGVEAPGPGARWVLGSTELPGASQSHTEGCSPRSLGSGLGLLASGYQR